eukprot:tig00021312_g20094.t1
MRACVVRQFGGPEVLEYVDSHPPPALTSELDVIVRVKACLISPVDALVREGAVFADIVAAPCVLGYCISGVIEETGAGVRDFAMGDEVCALLPPGSSGGYAELSVVNAYELVRKGEGVGHEAAAASLGAGVRAFTAFRRLHRDDTLLLHSGASGPGHIALQVARLYGVKLFVTAGSDEELALVRSLAPRVPPPPRPAPGRRARRGRDVEGGWCGAGRAVDGRREEAGAVVLEETGGVGADCVLDDEDLAYCRALAAPRPPSASDGERRAGGAGKGERRGGGAAGRGEGKGKGAGLKDLELNLSKLKSSVDAIDSIFSRPAAAKPATPPVPPAPPPPPPRPRPAASPLRRRESDGEGREGEGAASAAEAGGDAGERKARHARLVRNIRCLATHGQLVTTAPDAQLDPPDTRELFLRNASVGFLFEHAWLLDGSYRGRYLHILMAVMENLSAGAIVPRYRTFPLTQLAAAHAALPSATGALVLTIP